MERVCKKYTWTPDEYKKQDVRIIEMLTYIENFEAEKSKIDQERAKHKKS